MHPELRGVPGDAMYGVTAGRCLEPIGEAEPVTIYAADDRTVIGGDLRDSVYL